MIKAAIFDLGGVVLESPLRVFALHEARMGLPDHFLNRIVVDTGPSGAWARLERGELSLAAFCKAFDAEVATAGGRISSAELMAELAQATTPRPMMVHAIRRIRSLGFKVAALTNNWVSDDQHTARIDALKPEFDVFIESSRVGLRKPDPEIYVLVCDGLGIRPEEAVFLDDMGRNLKPARALGMTTIKVTDPNAALRELEQVLGTPLR